MDVASVVKFISSIAWMLFIGGIALAAFMAYRGRSVKPAITFLVVMGIAALVLTSLGMGMVFIAPQERGVVISAVSPLGYRQQALQPGLRWIIPFFESVVRYPISNQTYTMSIASSEGQIQGDDSITARTSDGQEIFVDASVIYAIDPAQVVDVHITWQDRYGDGLVRPLARGIIRDVVSQYGVEEVYSTQRVAMNTAISEEMTTQLNANGLMLVSFILRNITFSEEYAASVEQKQIAEQQAQQAVFVVESKKQEAEQARQTAQGVADAVVIRAQGDAEALIIAANAEAEARVIAANAEAEALRLIADALGENRDLLLYQYIGHLSPGIQVMLVPNDNPYLLTLPTLPTGDETTVPAP